MTKNTKLVLVFLCTLVYFTSPAQNIDINLLKPINKHETGFKNRYADITASSVKPLSIAVPLGIAIAGFISHDKNLKQDALYMGGSIAVSSIITWSTKNIVNRKRPYYEYPFIIKRYEADYWLSFPSGHTSAAFCTATSVAMRYRKWYVIAPAYVYAASIGWARMYQGVHYPSDVLGGAIVGAGSAWLGYKAQKWITHKKERKKKLTL